MSAAVQVVIRERRYRQRFPVATALEYILQPDAIKPKKGRGVTVNLSASSILFEAEELLPVGKKITVALEWPVLLMERTRLRVVVQGRVARTEGKYVAVCFSRYEFRTRPLKQVVA